MCGGGEVDGAHSSCVDCGEIGAYAFYARDERGGGGEVDGLLDVCAGQGRGDGGVDEWAFVYASI